MKDKIIIKESIIQGPYSKSKISKGQLIGATRQYQKDVKEGLAFFINEIAIAAALHDHTKIERIDDFYEDISTGFKTNKWLDGHIKDERHHLLRYVPEDVNFVDILEFLVDSVMAGLARAGHYEPREVPDELLQKAFKNTVKKLIDIVEIDYA